MSDSEKYNDILSGLHDEEAYDNEDPYFGIGGAIFLYWSYNNKLLNNKIFKAGWFICGQCDLNEAPRVYRYDEKQYWKCILG